MIFVDLNWMACQVRLDDGRDLCAMPLAPELDGLRLRAVLALTVRTAQRILPLADKPPGAEELCREAIDNVSSFVMGSGPSLFEIHLVNRELTEAAHEDLAKSAVLLVANAGGEAAHSPFSPEHARRALDFARSSVSAAEQVAGSVLSAPFGRDRSILETTHSGHINDNGDPIDLGKSGSLGLLWGFGERSPWQPDIPASTVLPAKEYISPTQIAGEPADFICFHLARTGIEAVRRTLLDAANSDLKPRPNIYVYAPNLRPSDRLDLNTLGAVVITDAKIGGQIPENEHQFATLLKYQVEESLAEWIIQNNTSHLPHSRFVDEQQPELKEVSRQIVYATDSKEVNKKYEELLDDLQGDLIPKE
jgi:hypothetical protein